jgi:hypothetical protein
VFESGVFLSFRRSSFVWGGTETPAIAGRSWLTVKSTDFKALNEEELAISAVLLAIIGAIGVLVGAQFGRFGVGTVVEYCGPEEGCFSSGILMCSVFKGINFERLVRFSDVIV